jgi:hypothetical protein
MNTLTAESDIDTDTYVRSSDFADHIGGVHFPPKVWAVFAQCEVPRTPAEIASRVGLHAADVLSALRRLSGKQLIQKNEIDWLAYIASLETPPSAPAAVAAPPVKERAKTITVPRETVVAADPPPPPAPEPVSSAGQLLEFTLENASAATARRQAAQQVLTFRVEKPFTRETGPQRSPKPNASRDSILREALVC